MAVLLEREVCDTSLGLTAIPFLHEKLRLLLKLLELDLGGLSTGELEFLNHLVDVLAAQLFSADHPLELRVYLIHLLPGERKPPCQLLDLLEAAGLRSGILGRLLIGRGRGVCFCVLSDCICLLVMLSTEVRLVKLSRGKLGVRKGSRRKHTLLSLETRSYRF